MPEFVVSGRQPQKNTSVNGVEIHTDGSPVSAQNPFSTDGDSVYAKDIDTANSSIGDFSGSVTDLFDNRTSTITTTTDNPSLTIALKRPIQTHNITIVTSSGNFSNVVITLKNAAGTTVETIDDSSNDTKYTSHTYALVDVDKFCVMTIQFMTTDAVTLSFLMIRKSIEVDAHLVALKPDGTITHINATAGGNLKSSVEEFDSSLTTDGKLNTVIYGATGDATYQVPRVDAVTHSLQVVDYPHHEIHSGSHFFFSEVITLANGASQDYLITTPDTTSWGHLIYEVTGALGATIGFFEGADRTGTTAQTVKNNNRNSATTATITVHKGQSGGSTDGTNIAPCGFGTGTVGGQGGNLTREDELILKQNTKYIFRVTNRATVNNDVCIKFKWYEHTNKTA